MRKREQWGVVCADSTFYTDIHSRRWSTTVWTNCRYQSLFYHGSWLKTLEAHECSTTVPPAAHSITWQLLTAGMFRNVTSPRVSPLRRVNGRIWVCGVKHKLGLCTHTWIFTSKKPVPTFLQEGHLTTSQGFFGNPNKASKHITPVIQNKCHFCTKFKLTTKLSFSHAAPDRIPISHHFKLITDKRKLACFCAVIINEQEHSV